MPPYDPWRHRYAVVCACATAVLLVAGGLVTSTGSGLAVPDWPLSFGRVFPRMEGGVLFEHGHRLVAATTGLLTVVLAVWFGLRETRVWARRLAYAAIAAVVAQGMLGGATVLLRLPPLVSVLHACLAQGFFGIVVLLAFATSKGFVERPPALIGDGGTKHLRMQGTVVTGVIFAQLILGAVMRHTGAGLAIPDVPLAFGRLLPPVWSQAIAVHFAHRVTALVIAGLVFRLAARILLRHPDRPELRIPALWAAGLVIVQILLGATTVLMRLAVVPATAHVVVGALLLADCLVLTVRASRALSSAKADPIETSRGGGADRIVPGAPARAAGSAA